MRFKEYYLLESQNDSNAYIFDADDTLFKTAAQIIIRDEEGNIIKKLTPAQYTTYEKQPHEHIDLSEFDLPDIIHQTAKPTKYFKVIQNISNAIKQKRSNSFIYVLTARGNKVKRAIHQFLKDRGVEVRLIDIHTIGDEPNKPISDIKKDVIQKIRDKHIGDVVFFDDDEKNIQMAQQVPGVKTRLVSE